MGPHHRVIEADSTSSGYWRELWNRRDLAYHMTMRNVVVPYKQTYLGIAWAIIQPFVVIIVMTLVFRRLARLPSVGEAPYPVMVFVALLPWQFFAGCMSSIGTSMVSNSGTLGVVYCPRLLFPITAIGTALHDLLLGLLMLGLMMLFYGYMPDWRVVTLPLFLLFAAATAFAFGIWIAVFNVYKRDFKFLVPYVLQLGMYISPVGFATAVVPMKWHFLYSLNPMVGVIDGCRWALLGGSVRIQVESLIISVTGVLVLLFFGLRLFRRKEGTFTDFL